MTQSWTVSASLLALVIQPAVQSQCPQLGTSTGPLSVFAQIPLLQDAPRDGTVGSCWQEAASGSILLKADRTETQPPRLVFLAYK